MFVGCPMDDLMGLNEIGRSGHVPTFNHSLMSHDSKFYTKPVCMTDCYCEKEEFGVICGKVYMISPINL